ncbi:Oidioi.mRNA.OKI2018_I69.chr1.g3340.t1.cds [Oikopleura dioica]|uniref:Oidioi.mRNA.OKI2018_I69.chr1.g3340.t1.cds n=1 Tax=Oikopleura dioica TaxID=34765 RepID=A0ABN7SVJ4_OIKDI|nr:Oidioi.mRNA.OKI2018_I69.chr1.g3340.t1.cds [Oikopleura dioica]
MTWDSFKRLAIVAQKTAKASLNAARTAVTETYKQNKIRAEAAEAREKEEAAQNKNFFEKMGPSREMSLSEAIEVLGIEDQYKTEEFTVSLIEERHEKMIEINQKGKVVSPYLVAKINNAKDSAIVAALMEAEKNSSAAEADSSLLVIKFLLAFAVYIADVNLLWLIAIFIMSNRIFTEGICRLCDLVIADLIDQDFVENDRKVTASAFFFGSTALLTKPGQSLAPIIGTALLTVAAGSDDIRARTEEEALTEEDFKSYCLVLTGVPMVCSILQILIWNEVMDANNYARAKFAYEPQNADELSLTKGDYVEILNSEEEEWWEARILTSNERGWIPKAYLRPLKGQKELDKVLRLLRKSPKGRNSGAEPVEAVVQNDWFKKVYIEVIEDSKKYLRDVEAIRTTCAKVREALGDTAYAVSKLEASSDKLRGVENRIVERFQHDIDSESPSAGRILNETLEEYRNVYESYHINHPTAVDSLQREQHHIQNLDLNAIRSSWAKPLLRLENFPLRLRDLEKYYGEADEDRNLLARSIYQIEEVLLQKCQSIRKNKELELAVLQQPIRNWTGDSIDELGSLRLMTPLMIRAGREIKAFNGYGLVFSSAIVLITATDRMSGFVLVANIPKVKLAVSRKSDTCVETTGNAGHFWFVFESKEDTDEWWGAMEALNVQISKSLSTTQILHPSDRSSFSEVNGHGPRKSRERPSYSTESSATLNVDNKRNPRSKSGSPFAVMAPVKHVPIRTSRNPVEYSSYNHNQSSPPPIKLCPSSSTLSTTEKMNDIGRDQSREETERMRASFAADFAGTIRVYQVLNERWQDKAPPFLLRNIDYIRDNDIRVAKKPPKEPKINKPCKKKPKLKSRISDVTEKLKLTAQPVRTCDSMRISLNGIHNVKNVDERAHKNFVQCKIKFIGNTAPHKRKPTEEQIFKTIQT